MGASCLLGIAVFVAIVALCQLIAGTMVGDWMHTSQIVKSFDGPVDEAWLAEQEENAWRFAADVLDGWGVPASGIGAIPAPNTARQMASKLVGDADDAANDDGGLIPAGGAKIATEYGLWGACVWSKTFSAQEQKMRETFSCKTYANLHDGSYISDDEAGKLAPTPSSANFGAAQALAVIACIGSGIALLASIVVMFLHGNAGSALKSDELLLGAESTEQDDVEEVDKWCTTGGVPFPTAGLAGRLAVASAVGAAVSAVAAFGALGAWADSQAAKELEQLSANSHGEIDFAMGSSMWMVGLGGGFALIELVVLGLGYHWFRAAASATATGEDGPVSSGGGVDVDVGSLQVAGTPASKASTGLGGLVDDDDDADAKV